MSFQIFLQGKILGTEEFLRSAANDIEGRAYWVSLLSEVVPRALLSELGLSAMLLGASGGGEFLLVLPTDSVRRPKSFVRELPPALTNGVVALSGSYGRSLKTSVIGAMCGAG